MNGQQYFLSHTVEKKKKKLTSQIDKMSLSIMPSSWQLQCPQKIKVNRNFYTLNTNHTFMLPVVHCWTIFGYNDQAALKKIYSFFNNSLVNHNTIKKNVARLTEVMDGTFYLYFCIGGYNIFEGRKNKRAHSFDVLLAASNLSRF